MNFFASSKKRFKTPPKFVKFCNLVKNTKKICIPIQALVVVADTADVDVADDIAQNAAREKRRAFYNL